MAFRRRGTPRGIRSGTGTEIYFEPDPDIFRTVHFDAEWIKSHLEDMSYIHRGLSITLVNEVTIELEGR